MNKEKLAVIMADLLRVVKQEKELGYRSGYADGVLDFYNEALKVIERTPHVR